MKRFICYEAEFLIESFLAARDALRANDWKIVLLFKKSLLLAYGLLFDAVHLL